MFMGESGGDGPQSIQDIDNVHDSNPSGPSALLLSLGSGAMAALWG